MKLNTRQVRPDAAHVVLLIFFLGFIGSIFIRDSWKSLDEIMIYPPTGSEYLDGSWARRMDVFLPIDYSYTFRRWRSTVTAGMYRYFAQLQPDMYMGPDRWLFVWHEMSQDPYLKKSHSLETAANMALAVLPLVKAREAEVLMVVPPNRVRIYPEHYYSHGSMAKEFAAAYQELRRKLKSVGAPSVDLEGLYLREKDRDKELGFLYNQADHHWTSRGCLLASQLVADSIRSQHPEWCDRSEKPVSLDKSTVRMTETTLSRNLGFIDDKLMDLMRSPAVHYTVSYEQPFTESQRLASPLVLIGDSFVHTDPGFMRNYLEYYLQTPVALWPEDMGVAERDPETMSLAGYLKAKTVAQHQPRFIIWETWELYLYSVRERGPQFRFRRADLMKDDLF